MNRDEDRAFPDHVAHTSNDDGRVRLHLLQDHLIETAQRAGDFASVFGAAEWAELAGLWHDLGKYSDAFQNYLAKSTSADAHAAEAAGKVDHATAGAQHAVRQINVLGHFLAHVIAGHHSGLLDAISSGACLEARLKKPVEPVDEAPPSITDRPPPGPCRVLQSALERRRGSGDFSAAFFTRMVFSCLVDADFLDTEAFMSPDRADLRPSWPPDLVARMEAALDRHVESIEATVARSARTTGRDQKVQAARAAVRRGRR